MPMRMSESPLALRTMSRDAMAISFLGVKNERMVSGLGSMIFSIAGQPVMMTSRWERSIWMNSGFCTLTFSVSSTFAWTILTTDRLYFCESDNAFRKTTLKARRVQFGQGIRGKDDLGQTQK